MTELQLLLKLVCGWLAVGLCADARLHAGSAAGHSEQHAVRRASASATKVWIQAGRFTLQELADTVGRADVLRTEKGVATLRGALELNGLTAELVIGPGETLRMRHVPVPAGQTPQPQQVLDRRIFLTEGKVDWRDCAIEDWTFLGHPQYKSDGHPQRTASPAASCRGHEAWPAEICQSGCRLLRSDCHVLGVPGNRGPGRDTPGLVGTKPLRLISPLDTVYLKERLNNNFPFFSHHPEVILSRS